MLQHTRQLLELQEVDTKIHDGVGHLERLASHKRQLEARIEQERAAVAALRDGLQKLELDSRARNLEVDELDEHIRGYQERLDKGIISFKEMEDLRAKIASERVRMSRLEDEALNLMGAIEAARAEFAKAEEELLPRVEHLEAQIRSIAREMEEEETGSLASLRAARADLAAATPAYALAQYETLRGTFPNPLVPVDHGTCGGCKIRVSANTVERVRACREIVTCEHCSRILFSL